MKKSDIEDIFRDMMLDFVKAERSIHDHWKIPKEEYIIRILSLPFSINIHKYKGQTATNYSVEEGVTVIQKIIQCQFESVHNLLYGSVNTDTWVTTYTQHMMSYYGIQTIGKTKI